MIRYLPLIGITLVALLLPGGVVHAENPMTFVVGLIMTVFLSIAGFFLWLSGELLSFVVTLTVLQAGKTMNLRVVEEVWTLFRAFGDILLLFVLLFIGIGTILRWQQYEIKKLLPPLVIVALLLNFSIFFTKVIVDFTNIIAIEFYQAATGNGQFRVSEVIADELGIIKIYDESSFANDKYGSAAQTSGSSLTAGDILVGGIMGIVLFLISAMILFSSAITLVVRFVILLFLMMLSPLAFVAYLTPATQRYAMLWWQTFLQNAIFAPVFFMLLWAALWVMQGIDIFSVKDGINLTTLNDSAAAEGGTSGQVPTAAAILLNFMIVIAMLVAALLIANKISKMGGNAVVRGANSIVRNAGARAGRFTARAGMDMTARAGRATIGAGMEKMGGALATSRTLAGVATSENKNFVQRWAAKSAIDAGRSIEKTGKTASFNPQSVVEKGLTGISKAAGGGVISLDANEEAKKRRLRGREQRGVDKAAEDANWAKDFEERAAAGEGMQAKGLNVWAKNETKRLDVEIERHTKDAEAAEIKVDEAEANLQAQKAQSTNAIAVRQAEEQVAAEKAKAPNAPAIQAAEREVIAAKAIPNNVVRIRQAEERLKVEIERAPNKTAIIAAEAKLTEEKGKKGNKEGVEEAERQLAAAKRDRQVAKNEGAKLQKEKDSVEKVVKSSGSSVFSEPAVMANKALEKMYADGSELDKATKEVDRLGKEITKHDPIIKKRKAYEDQKASYQRTADSLRKQHEEARARNDGFGMQQIDRLIAENGRKLQEVSTTIAQTEAEYNKAAEEQTHLKAQLAIAQATIASNNEQVKSHLEAIKAGMKEVGKQHLETQKSLAADRIVTPKSYVSYTSWARSPKHYREALDMQIKKNYPTRPPKKSDK